MNRSLPQTLMWLFFASALNVYILSASAASVVAETQKAPSGTQKPAEEQEYNESKLFPKKGKYLDWIEANKLNNQGIKLARAGKYKEAISMFQKAIQRYSHDYSYYENLGGALHNNGNLERAASSTEMAAQLAPRRWGPWYNLGIILTKEHEYVRALKALKRAKALHAPASKTAGIEKLIVALEKKIGRSIPAPVETGDETSTASDEPATTESKKDGTSASAGSSNGDADPGITASPAQNSGTNPYTTIPAVSPLPMAPANSIEKGN